MAAGPPPAQGCRFWRALRDVLFAPLAAWWCRCSAVSPGAEPRSAVWYIPLLSASACRDIISLLAACRSASLSSAVCLLPRQKWKYALLGNKRPHLWRYKNYPISDANVAVERIALVLEIREIPGLKTSYPD